jgi:hypothetical protein
LYIEPETTNEDHSKSGHYALIKNFDKLVYSSLGTHSDAIICKRCMNHFRSQEVYEKHNYYCTLTQPNCEMPEEGEILEFNNRYRKLRHPIVIAADFETLLVPQPDGNSKHVSSSAEFVVDYNQVERFQLNR